MARKMKNAGTPQPVDEGLIAKALAKAVTDGDMVNFRFLFLPASPARVGGSERFGGEKYSYLLPEGDEEQEKRFQEALAAVQEPGTWDHVTKELAENRPAQLPWPLVLQLADNAVRLGKYTSAAQGYERLRIRGQMQDTFLEQADEALDSGDTAKAVRGYIVATGLDYDYAAFPEPLPKEPDHQTQALMLHGDYPERPEDSLPLQEADAFLNKALAYLLLNSEAAARLESRSTEVRTAFLAELVAQCDPEWPEFTERYREACVIRERFDERIQRALSDLAEQGSRGVLLDELEGVLGEDPRQIPAALLGRPIEEGEWWQYLKELAYKHPAAALFVSRQLVGETEVLVPRFRPDSPAAAQLKLLPA